MSAVMVPPSRTVEQRNAALAEGNRVRILRSQAKRDLTLRGAYEFIGTPPEWMRRMPLEQLLIAVPKLGPVSVRKLLRRLQIADVKTVGGLSYRQRNDLLRELRARMERAC